MHHFRFLRRSLLAASTLSLLFGASTMGGPAHLTSVAEAAGLPSSCAQLVARHMAASNGSHLIFIGYEPIVVTCAGMPSAPATYLTLPHTGSSSNYSYRQGGGYWYSYSNYTVTTRFTRVRLLGSGDSLGNATCTAAACIYTSDFTFSSSSGWAAPQAYATASACNWWGAPGTANVDVRGLRVKVAPAAFYFDAYAPSVQHLQYSDNNQVVNLAADGQCGGYAPTTAPLLPLQPLAGFGS